ncbi:MAG: serine kinase [Clostridia bacterium]|nr:serine kinase [Clostridia bacterium]
MNFSALAARLSLEHAAGPVPASFDGVYAGDLLSRVMSRLEKDQLWITIMNNVNVVAVASLSEAAAVILAEDVSLLPEAAAAAEEKGIAVFRTEMTAYEICREISRLADGGAI